MYSVKQFKLSASNSSWLFELLYYLDISPLGGAIVRESFKLVIPLQSREGASFNPCRISVIQKVNRLSYVHPSSSEASRYNK